MRLLLIASIVFPATVALAVAPLPADAVESVRVHQLVDRMEDAVERADFGAYMALIDTGDPVFATEQRAWAADLLSHPVAEIDFDIAADEPVRLLDDGSAAARIEIAWRLPGGEARSFAYPALFRPVGSPRGQWLFTGRAWDIALLDTPGVRVYADAEHEELARLALSRVPELRDTIAADFGRDLSGADLQEVVVKIYPDMGSLQGSIYLSYTDPLSGWNEPGESIKIVGREDLEQARLDPLLAHEIGHAVSFEFGPQITDAPWWALEGVAEVAAGLFRDSWRSKHSRIAEMARSDNLREWDLLADFRGEANNHMLHVYLQGWSMVDYIDRTFGSDARNAWFTAMGRGQSLDSATSDALGIDFTELDAQWRDHLRASASDERTGDGKTE